MNKLKEVNNAPVPTDEELTKQTEEAAYFSWLNRGRFAQVGDELHDWIEAEKEVRDSLKITPPTN